MSGAKGRIMNNGYGFDRLSRDALIASTALCFIGVVLWHSFSGRVFCMVSAFLMALILFRTLSARSERRRAELIAYENLTFAIRDFFSGLYARILNMRSNANAGRIKRQRDGAYRYFKCPNCKKEYRAPKGRGLIRVTCRECGIRFEKKV